MFLNWRESFSGFRHAHVALGSILLYFCSCEKPRALDCDQWSDVLGLATRVVVRGPGDNNNNNDFDGLLLLHPR